MPLVRIVTRKGDEVADDTHKALKTLEQFGGEVYENQDTATADTARRFETEPLKLRDVIIQVATNSQSFGDVNNQRYVVAADDTLGFTRVDLSKLYFKNTGAGSNGTVRILGVKE